MSEETLAIDNADNPSQHPLPTVRRNDSDSVTVFFDAMASPCEVHIELDEKPDGRWKDWVREAVVETWRIEAKFSRYRADNPVHRINNAQGARVEVDNETADLLDYAARCHELSQGMFDITSGPLRRVWSFSGSQRVPSQRQIDQVLTVIGWNKCEWERPYFRMPWGGEIDMGGIGKEYAVDKVGAQLGLHVPCLINFGGDLACYGARRNTSPWRIGLQPTAELSPAPSQMFDLRQGGIATSGDTYRYLLYKGRRLSHILNPNTGWPVFEAPQTVTVHATSCTLAGMLATFAMLHGRHAETFLEQQRVQYWVQRTGT